MSSPASKEATVESMLYSYKHGFSGFSATLTESQAKQISKILGVIRVTLSRSRKLVTTRSRDFLGLDYSHPTEILSKTNQGDGVIIGVVDSAEKAHYAARDPIMALKKYLIKNSLANESELKAIEKKIDEVVEEAVEFADASPLPPCSQLLENVFADPKGFGIGPDGRYRCEDPGFTAGTAQV